MLALIVLAVLAVVLYFLQPASLPEDHYPAHIAFIMDGNGRWAQRLNQPRTYGHAHASKNVRDILTHCFTRGTDYLTFYVFSEQNWKRPEEEVEKIFKILYKVLKTVKYLRCYRILVQGRTDRIPPKLKALLDFIVETTKDCDKTVIFCLDYSGRSEILHACKQLISRNLEPTEENFASQLYVKNIPDPDLIIRTSGEQRISDFLLWQLSYSEFYFTDVYWPDFTVAELDKAVKSFNSRQRRFGGLKLLPSLGQSTVSN